MTPPAARDESPLRYAALPGRADAWPLRPQGLLPMSEAEFVLKSTPPRVPRAAFRRERLLRRWEQLRERTAVAVVAPRGFGKTTLLSQWRLCWLERGARVAWLRADEQDDPVRFAAALRFALDAASGRPAANALPTGGHVEALTQLLAQVAAMGAQTVLVLDEAERLPAASMHGALAYVLRNAPANLHLLLASRLPLPLEAWDLAAAGEFETVGADELRLRLDEANAILDRRFGDRLTLDQRARLHAIADGWPIGLQLAAATIEREADLDRAIDALSGRRGDIARYFIETLLARLPAPVGEFLVRVAMLEHLDAPLCEAVTHSAQAGEFLELLLRETPIVSAGEDNDTYRLHPLARDFLMAHFEALPVEERDALHCRAFHWFARQDRYHEAACHALAANDESAGHAHAARALWTLGTQGRLAEAAAWLERLPRELLAGDTELELVAAWIEAFGPHNGRSLATAMRTLDDPRASPRLRVIASRVAGGAAAYADRVGLLPGLVEGLPDARTVIDDPLYVLAVDNAAGLSELHAGETASLRRRLDRPPPPGDQRSLPLALAFSRMLIGGSYLWDGESARSEAWMRPVLEEAERLGDRRGAAACMYAAILAAAVLDRGGVDEAEALLANRLDVIERVGIPEVVLYAYRTLEQCALARGDERRALHVLANLHHLAEVRALPRLAMHAFGEEVRLHSLGGRPRAAAVALEALAGLAPVFASGDLAPFASRQALTLAIARMHEALARSDVDAAEGQLAIAEALAARLRRGGDLLELKVMRAVLAGGRDRPLALALLQEALSLGVLRGRTRLLAETHPLAVRLGAELAGEVRAALPAPAPPAVAPAPVPATGRSGPLTPKEADVLRLLGSGLSNKHIARALEVSDETVKWHLKNLFLKLSAGSRKHAVDRARLLGLLGS